MLSMQHACCTPEPKPQGHCRWHKKVTAKRSLPGAAEEFRQTPETLGVGAQGQGPFVRRMGMYCS